MTASTDGSVRLWLIAQEKINKPQLIAVYQTIHGMKLARFCPAASEELLLVLTAGNDNKISIWSYDEVQPGGSITGSLPVGSIGGHCDDVTALAFSHDKTNMFTGDSSGAFKIWLFNASDDGTLRLNFDCIATMQVDNVLKEPIINIAVQLHDRRVVLQTSSNKLRMVDLRIQRFVSEFKHEPMDSNNQQCLACIFSPCGTFLITSGKEDEVLVFSTVSSMLLTTFNKLGYRNHVTSISFHPFDHSIAFSCAGADEPLILYTWDDSIPPLFEDDDDILPPMTPLSPR